MRNAQLAKKVVDRIGFGRVAYVENAEHVAEDAAAFEQSECLDHPGVGRAPISGLSELVMKRGGPVTTQTHGEAAFQKEVRPGLAEEQAVGLQSVRDGPPRGRRRFWIETIRRKYSTPARVGSPPCHSKWVAGPGEASSRWTM